MRKARKGDVRYALCVNLFDLLEHIEQELACISHKDSRDPL
jgi:hypothetical protein